MDISYHIYSRAPIIMVGNKSFGYLPTGRPWNHPARKCPPDIFSRRGPLPAALVAPHLALLNRILVGRAYKVLPCTPFRALLWVQFCCAIRVEWLLKRSLSRRTYVSGRVPFSRQFERAHQFSNEQEKKGRAFFLEKMPALLSLPEVEVKIPKFFNMHNIRKNN